MFCVNVFYRRGYDVIAFAMAGAEALGLEISESAVSLSCGGAKPKLIWFLQILFLMKYLFVEYNCVICVLGLSSELLINVHATAHPKLTSC